MDSPWVNDAPFWVHIAALDEAEFVLYFPFHVNTCTLLVEFTPDFIPDDTTVVPSPDIVAVLPTRSRHEVPSLTPLYVLDPSFLQFPSGVPGSFTSQMYTAVIPISAPGTDGVVLRSYTYCTLESIQCILDIRTRGYFKGASTSPFAAGNKSVISHFVPIRVR